MLTAISTVDWESEKKRGETALNNLIPESVEWMNNLLQIVWGLVNPDMLSGTADMLEDILQASSPKIIQNIRYVICPKPTTGIGRQLIHHRVADISQGSNPIRILSLRALPDSQVQDLKKAATAARDGKDEEQRKAEEDGGEVYNLEVAFAYNAAPIESKAVSGRTRNMHMQLVFYTGIKGLVGIPLRMLSLTSDHELAADLLNSNLGGTKGTGRYRPSPPPSYSGSALYQDSHLYSHGYPESQRLLYSHGGKGHQRS